MDAIKRYMQPKGWLTGVGGLFTIFMLLTYAEIMNAAETGWRLVFSCQDIFIWKMSNGINQGIDFL
jgi:hypothetical protein